MKAWATEEYCSLACSSLLAQSAFHITHLLRDATAHSGLGPSTSIINQENVPQTCLQANLMQVFSQLRFIFPDDPGLCQFVKTLNSAAQGTGHSAVIARLCQNIPFLCILLFCLGTDANFLRSLGAVQNSLYTGHPQMPSFSPCERLQKTSLWHLGSWVQEIPYWLPYKCKIEDPLPISPLVFREYTEYR